VRRMVLRTPSFSAGPGHTVCFRCPRMEGGDSNGTHPQAEEVEGLQQLRRLLAHAELPNKRSREKKPSLPVIVGVDGSYFQLRFLQDRRTETPSVLPYRDRRAVEH
jgi:hypothetical protein